MLDRRTLERVAEESRESARVQDHSARLRLQWIYQTYGFAGRTETAFVAAFRRFPLPVIARAEQAFARQAHRSDIANRMAYFAEIVRRFGGEYRLAQIERQRQEARDFQWQADLERVRAQRAAREGDPLVGLHAALDILPAYWDSKRQQLCGDGAGPGRVGTRTAIDGLIALHGPTAAVDIVVTVALRDFADAKAGQLEPTLVAAIHAFVRCLLPHAKALPTPCCAATFASTILRRIGKYSTHLPRSSCRLWWQNVRRHNS